MPKKPLGLSLHDGAHQLLGGEADELRDDAIEAIVMTVLDGIAEALLFLYLLTKYRRTTGYSA